MSDTTQDATVPRLGKPFSPSKPRRGEVPVDLIVIHESCTRTRTACEAVLRRKGYGVHVIVDEFGQVWLYNDPGSEALGHAGPLNTRSIGVELISPYYDADATGKIWGQRPRIKARWAHKGWYVVPMPEQLEALYNAVLTLCGQHPIACTVVGKVSPKGGILAHIDSPHDAHADGRFPATYIQQRLWGAAPEAAFKMTVQALTSP